MAASKIVILEPAVSEIAESCAFYNQKLPGLGDEFEEEIFQLFEFIRSNPLLFPLKFAHIREVPMKRFPFVINYEILGKQIIVSAVFHTKQNPAKKKKRKGR